MIRDKVFLEGFAKYFLKPINHTVYLISRKKLIILQLVIISHLKITILGS